ncbi:MAG: hypothetical protein OXG37_10725 [Actinomycetia bacterium]|nr:hypothetical protein [Actinomycetes bacterium]
MTTPILHVSQIAPILGLPTPAALGAAGLAWDCTRVLGGWVELIETLAWEVLVQKTPSRGRSLRNLTVNVFHPFELLTAAWSTGSFDWDPELDTAREEQLRSAHTIVRYARERHVGWLDFVLGHEAQLDDADRLITSPRGEITFANLLTQQRWHAAFHYRQLVAFLGGEGHDVGATVDLAAIGGLELPADIF